MILLQLAITLLSIYILIESHLAICKMPAGWVHFCSKLKYVFAFSCALVFIYYSWNSSDDMQWMLFGFAGTLALFIWPRMIWRVRHYIDELKCLEL